MNQQPAISAFACPDDLPVLDDDPFSIENLREPLVFHTRLREAGPVAWLSRYGFYAVGGFAECEQVLSDWRTFTSTRGVGTLDIKKEKPWREPAVLLEADPPRHNEIRLRVGRILSSKAVEALRGEFILQAHVLLDRVLQTREFNAVPKIAEAYPLRVFGDAVGLDEDRRDMLLVYGDMGFNNFGPHNDLLTKSMEYGRATGAIEWMMAHTQRDALRPGSLGAQFHTLADEGFLTQAEAWNVMRGQLTAGVDTTIAALSHALLCLARDPDQFAQMRAEPALAKGAFEEAVRHLTPLQTLFRTSQHDSELGGSPVRADFKILVALAAANHDPRKFREPDRFDLRRSAMDHLAFGRGVHVCLGMNVARLEAECLLTAFASRVKAIELMGEPEYRLNNTVRRLENLPLRVQLV